MENDSRGWLVLAAALLAMNALTVNARPQEVTALVEQGLAQNQAIPMFGPIDSLH